MLHCWGNFFFFWGMFPRAMRGGGGEFFECGEGRGGQVCSGCYPVQPCLVPATSWLGVGAGLRRETNSDPPFWDDTTVWFFFGGGGVQSGWPRGIPTASATPMASTSFRPGLPRPLVSQLAKKVLKTRQGCPQSLRRGKGTEIDRIPLPLFSL